MRRRVLVLVVALAPCVFSPTGASADAIMPFEGECPPGTERGIQNHSEACIPMQCESDGDCGWGASCVTHCVCRAEREVHTNGRVVYEPPRLMVMQVGLCDDSGACAEGDPGDRTQCEPDGDTPAFDRERHRWTGEPHSGGCAGCAAAGRSPAGAPALVVLVGLLLAGRRGSSRPPL